MDTNLLFCALRSFVRRALVVGAIVGSLSACVATPIPDPPSLDASLMSLVDEGGGTVRLSGAAGAARPGSRALRVTNPSAPTMASRAEVFAAADGSFSAAVLGTTADTLYLEGLTDAADTFELAVRLEGGSVVEATPGGDRDMDGSPDLVDCAPDDRTQSGRRCASTCSTDMDCAAGQVCMAGVCVAMSCELAETCGNGLDDDCDGVADDGC